MNATVTALYGFPDQASQVTAAQLATGAIVLPDPAADLRVSTRSTLEVRRPEQHLHNRQPHSGRAPA